MNKVLVLYQSKYGSTKKYAEMLENEIPCDVFDITKPIPVDLNAYEIIIIAGGIYASHIAGIKYLKKHLDSLKNKTLAIFAVGASPYDENTFETIKAQHLKKIPLDIPMFYGRGAYDESVMSFKDRTLCRLLKKSLRKKDPATLEPWMEAFFEADGKACDWVDISYLNPLIAYIKEKI